AHRHVGGVSQAGGGRVVRPDRFARHRARVELVSRADRHGADRGAPALEARGAVAVHVGRRADGAVRGRGRDQRTGRRSVEPGAVSVERRGRRSRAVRAAAQRPSAGGLGVEIEQQINRLLEQGESGRALALAGEHYPEWLASGRLAEGRECLQRVLDAPPGMETASRVTALLGAGMLEFRQGDDRNARRLFDEALAVARRVGDTAQEARALNSLARVALRGRDPARVQELAREAWRLYEHVGDRPGVATSRHMTAAATRMKGDHAGSDEEFEQGMADARAALGERFEEVWKAGAAMGTDDAVAQALANTEERVRPEGSEP